jgi:hypothetical protein
MQAEKHRSKILSKGFIELAHPLHLLPIETAEHQLQRIPLPGRREIGVSTMAAQR